MNPISKKIINKLSQEDKTELKSEKVELSLVSDFKTEYALAVKNSLSLTDEFSNIENKKQKLISKIKKNINQFKNLSKPYNKISASAKEIGVDINDILDNRPNLDRDIKSMNEFINLLK
jgi:hypothetical protein